jgi:3',5'-cyclic AMP phosphodiesterase CpdA
MLIAQLSDTHIRPAGQLYQGVVDSNQMFRDALEHLYTLDQRPDLILLTGDLVERGRPEEYLHARELLRRLDIPYLVIPGNHDHRENFRAAFADHRYLPAEGPLHYCIDAYPVRIVGLDSTVPGKHHGQIDGAGLEWLAQVLGQDTLKPTIIMMHHPPFVTGIPYMDEYGCTESGRLAAVVERFSNIEMLVCGHVHRQMLRRWAGTVACSCPSTTSEIDLQLDPLAQPRSHVGPRACMLHLFRAEHGFVSHVSQIGKFAGPYAFA